MNKILKALGIGMASLAFVASSAVALPVYATSEGSNETIVASAASDLAKQGVNDAGGDENGDSLETVIKRIVNTVFLVLGIIAVVMIIVGGVNYATSMGDPGKATKAKNTIMYSVVGLVIALLAFAIVNFVIDAIAG